MSGLKLTDEVVARSDGKWMRRADLSQHFISLFNAVDGTYIRSSVIRNGEEADEEPFRASFPHLIDVGIMGHCIHGKTGLCRAAGIGCYQSGGMHVAPNMALADFMRIADECSGYTDQFALVGRGDPDCHEHFEEILAYCREKRIVPNYTTSGYAFDAHKAELSRKYCGAVAVSWYRNTYTNRAISLLLERGVCTNIHYVLSHRSIDEAIERLERDDFPEGIHAVIFLLHKPAGQGLIEDMPRRDDPRVERFFSVAVGRRHPFQIDFDSCSLPGILRYGKTVDSDSVDACEGARFSMYISPDMRALPCSFDVGGMYAVSLRENSIYEAWHSDRFEAFRSHMQEACPTCSRRAACFGGCPLFPEIVLCQRDGQSSP